jgi:hypothetical protein
MVRESNGVCGEKFVLKSAAGRFQRVTVYTAPMTERQADRTEYTSWRGEITVNREDDESLLKSLYQL